MKISNESKVGVFAAITITVMILGYNFMKGRDLFTRTNTYYAIFRNVDGLVASNPVMINGYRIGQVTKVTMIPHDSMRLVVEIDVESKIQVPRDSYIKIYSNDLFGAKAVTLELGQSPVMADNKDTLAPKLEPGIMENLTKITAPLREKVESILGSLDSTLNGPAGDQLRAAMEKLPATIETLNSTVRSVNYAVEVKLNNIIHHSEAIIKTISDNRANFDKVISNMTSFSDTLVALRLQETLNRSNYVLEELNTTFSNINKGKGTLGQLAQNEKLYEELEKTAHDLDELVKDLKARPKRYLNFSVFGGSSEKDAKKGKQPGN